MDDARRYEQPLFFLSHSHRDGALATALARFIERDFLRRHGRKVEVFNTSEQEHRLQEDVLRTKPGTTHDKALEDQLDAIIGKSRAYLLLVTARSLEENRPLINHEMTFADSVAKSREESFFFPVVTAGATLSNLVRTPTAINYQGIDLSDVDLLSMEDSMVTFNRQLNRAVDSLEEVIFRPPSGRVLRSV